MSFTLTAGELLQVVTFLVAALAVYNRLSEKITKLETKLDVMFEWWQNEVQNPQTVRQFKNSLNVGDGAD